jgi:3-oxoacyl-[acyl-carrier-protein] synthase-3
MPELPPGQQWEVDASLVDPEGLIARATGATRANGAKRTAGPGIAAVAAALPKRVVENAELAGPLGVDSGWISSRTGIHRRRRVGSETLVDLAADAGIRALTLAELDPAELDLVLVATFTPDQLQPHAAPLVASRLGADSAGAIDVGAACTGFLSALSLATAQLESGRARAALVVGAEVLSRVTDYDDRRTAGLFGDGAGAAVLRPGGPGLIGPIALRSDGGRAELIQASNEERLIRMDGRATFRAAVDAMSAVTRQVVSDAGLALEEIDLFVYHQANSRIISAVGERLDLPADRVIDCLAEYGNTSAASIPIALAQAADQGLLRHGSRVLLSAFGAGLTWGAGIVEWEGSA